MTEKEQDYLDATLVTLKLLGHRATYQTSKIMERLIYVLSSDDRNLYEIYINEYHRNASRIMKGTTQLIDTKNIEELCQFLIKTIGEN